MRLHEHQAKELFAEKGITVPASVLIDSVDDVDEALETVGLPCVIKAQVLEGGRGKAGLITLADTVEKARSETERIFAASPKVKRILIEEAISIEKELYVAMTIDATSAKGLLLASREGGVEIETLAGVPGAIKRVHFDIREGVMRFQAARLGFDLGLEGAAHKGFVRTIMALNEIYRSFDCELAEINPLFLTKEGSIVAGDAKVMIDDNALFRQTRFQQIEDTDTDEVEKMAQEEGIPFIRFDGDIGLMCAGAGLTTTVYDLVNYAGGSVANYLEFGGPNYHKAVKAMEICLKVPSKVILIVTFGTIARADVMAEGIVEAIRTLKPDRPIVTCIRGTNENEAVEILEKAGLKPLFDTEEAVEEAVALAKEAQS